MPKPCKIITSDCEMIHEDLVSKAKARMLDEKTLNKISTLYKILADSTRLKIIDLLSQNELCVCDIAVLLKMTKSAVSHQLKRLRDLNMVKTRREGKEVFYTLSNMHLAKLVKESLNSIDDLKLKN